MKNFLFFYFKKKTQFFFICKSITEGQNIFYIRVNACHFQKRNKYSNILQKNFIYIQTFKNWRSTFNGTYPATH